MPIGSALGLCHLNSVRQSVVSYIMTAQANFKKFFKIDFEIDLKRVNLFIDFEIDLKIIFKTDQISNLLLQFKNINS